MTRPSFHLEGKPEMQWTQKALDTVVGAGFQRQDLSNVISLVDGPERPIMQAMPQIRATALVHYWEEQNLIKPGAGAASYPEGARPNADAVAPVRQSNQTCNTGKTASVTDNLAAVWNGAGGYKLAEGEEERMLAEAINFQTTLKTIEVMNEMEWMHLCGDAANPQTTSVFPGGQTDGLLKWITTNGNNFGTGGTTGTPVNFTEAQVRDAMRLIAEGNPTHYPNRLLVAPELKIDINSFIGGGAGRPLVQISNKDSSGFTAGQEVDRYQTGYGVVEVKTEPYLSPLYNSGYTPLTNTAAILYNTNLVKQANLIAIGAEPLARIGTSVERMVTAVYSQEHRVPKHASVLLNVKSAIA
jgi:hypothetical protein